MCNKIKVLVDNFVLENLFLNYFMKAELWITTTKIDSRIYLALYYCKLVIMERLLFCVTTDVYFICFLWLQLGLASLLYSVSLVFPLPNMIDYFTIYDRDRKTD